jgi:hypothetical protein
MAFTQEDLPTATRPYTTNRGAKGKVEGGNTSAAVITRGKVEIVPLVFYQ